MSRGHRLLVAALLLLAALFGWGFRDALPVQMFAALPPLMLAVALWLRIGAAAFWAGIFALAWFSYGVMEAWTLTGSGRAFALAVVALSLVIVGASSWGGMKARFGRKDASA